MEVCFYKAKGNLFNFAVRKITRSKYSHVELLFSDGVSISSSKRDGGVRKKVIEYDVEKWDRVKLDVGVKHEALVRAWAESQLGKPYDTRALFGFLFYPIPQDKKKYYCSEYCARCLGLDAQAAGRTSPEDLHDLVSTGVLPFLPGILALAD
jgi:uncharacterized protein YycO